MTQSSRVELGSHWSYNLLNDPKRLVFVLSRYKFAAEVISKGKNILELGCSEGIGVPILSEFAESYLGIDSDGSAIETAMKNWQKNNVEFKKDDFLGQMYGSYDAVVSLDVVEHIPVKKEKQFFDTVAKNLHMHGIAVIGTPNATASEYASEASKAGHVNLYNGERLRSTMQELFHNVFLFGMNDEIVHTGFVQMAHCLVCVGCEKKSGS